MSHLKYTVAFIVFLLTFSCYTLSKLPDKVIINDVNWPPYFFLEDQSEYIGLGKEIILQCFSKMSIETDFINLPIKRTHLSMMNGTIDIAIYSFKEERQDYLHYSNEALFKTDYGFMVLKNSNIEIKELTDLSPYVMGHLAGLTYTPELLNIVNKKINAQEAVVANSMEAVFSQLLATKPRIEIVANPKETLQWQAKLLGVRDKIKVLDYKIKTKSYFVTVSKKSNNIIKPVEFLDALDICIRDLKTKGTYKEILWGYGIEE